MAQQTKVKKPTQKKVSEAPPEQKAEPKSKAAVHDEIVSEIDSLLDEIDEVLEENAEEFVQNYQQKGGE